MTIPNPLEYTKRRAHPTLEAFAYGVLQDVSYLPVDRVNAMFHVCKQCWTVINGVPLGAGPLFNSCVTDASQQSLNDGTPSHDGKVLDLITRGNIWYPDLSVERVFATAAARMGIPMFPIRVRDGEQSLEYIVSSVHSHLIACTNEEPHNLVWRFWDMKEKDDDHKRDARTLCEAGVTFSGVLRGVPYPLQYDLDLFLVNRITGVPLVVVEHSERGDIKTLPVVRSLAKKFGVTILFARMVERNGQLVVSTERIGPNGLSVSDLSVNSASALKESIAQHVWDATLPRPTSVIVPHITVNNEPLKLGMSAFDPSPIAVTV